MAVVDIYLAILIVLGISIRSRIVLWTVSYCSLIRVRFSDLPLNLKILMKYKNISLLFVALGAMLGGQLHSAEAAAAPTGVDR